jgi:LPXTG-motif cell wall-anchored protein
VSEENRMQFDELEPHDEVEEERVVAEESSNRTFLIIAGILGAVALLALMCIAVYAFILYPRTKANQNAQATEVAAQQTLTGEIVAGTATSAAQTSVVAAYTATPTITPIPPSATPTITPTPVVAMPTSAGAGAGGGTVSANYATATARYTTLEAIVTQNAATANAATVKAPQATTIPKTGFADDVGLPAMLGLAVLLVVVIFLARRLRTAS